MFPDIRQPKFGCSRTFSSLAFALGVPVLADLVSFPRMSSGIPWSSVNIAEFFRTPTCSFSCADLKMVAARNNKLMNSSPIGRVNHSHRTDT